MHLPFFFNGGPVSVETFSRSNYLVGKCPLAPFAPLEDSITPECGSTRQANSDTAVRQLRHVSDTKTFDLATGLAAPSYGCGRPWPHPATGLAAPSYGYAAAKAAPSYGLDRAQLRIRGGQGRANQPPHGGNQCNTAP